MSYSKDNQGSIFVEETKKSDKHPDFKGSITVEGKEYWVSGWKRIGNNKKFISLSIDPKQPKSYQPPPTREDHSNAW